MAALFVRSPKTIDLPLFFSACGRVLETGCHGLAEEIKLPICS
jgi:hypothetical protein